MHHEQGADAIALCMNRKQLHPARIDANQRLARGRGQAGDRPIITFGSARNRQAVAAVTPEDLKNLLCLRPAQQLLEPRQISEAQLQGFRALVGVGRDCPALQPVALLLEIEESA